MRDILAEIVAKKRETVQQWRRQRPLEELRGQVLASQGEEEVLPARVDVVEALKGCWQEADLPPRLLRVAPLGGRSDVGRRGWQIIAELKRRSPSRGAFAWHGDVSRQVRAYEAGGATMISVVTDAPFFDGSLALFHEVRQRTDLPLLQKDFFIDPYQVYLARELGADAILLIVSILSAEELEELLALANTLGLATLVEVHDAEELQRAQQAGAKLIGINNRNLKTFHTTLTTTLDLLPLCDAESVVISESGLQERSDLARLHAAGVDGFLIGETLMRAPDAERVLRSLSDAPTSAAGELARG